MATEKNAAVGVLTEEICKSNSTGSFQTKNLNSEKNAANISPVSMHCLLLKISIILSHEFKRQQNMTIFQEAAESI